MIVMDLSSFIDEMDNDLDDVNMIVSEFSNSIEAQIPKMYKLLNKKEYHDLSREAHSIKGGARNIMAPGLEIAAENLEKCSAGPDKTEIKKFLEELTSEYSRFKKFINNYLKISL